MKKSILQKGLQKLRNYTPLTLRQKIGSMIAYLYYLDRLYLRPHHNIPHVLNAQETVDKVLREELSMIRFGDGEISLLDDMDLPFQKHSKELAEKLEKIFLSRDKKLLICIPNIWGDLRDLLPYAYTFNMHHLYRHGHIWKKLLSYTSVYGDTNVTRSYLALKDRTHAPEIFHKLRLLWDGKEVVLIEGEKSRLGVGNDLFDNVKSLQRILGPKEHAFSKYKELLAKVKEFDRNHLILLSLGPTAKVLAYELFLLGYRVLDIGHVDMEYEMFLRKAEKQEKVAYKYFNEINERNPEDCTDEKYLSQIVAKIL